LGKFYVGLNKNYIGLLQLILFSERRITGSLFNDEEVEHAVQNVYQIKKYIVSPIKSGMVIVDQQRAHQRVLYEQF
jgi:DNA mismatch repair protein MutL